MQISRSQIAMMENYYFFPLFFTILSCSSGNSVDLSNLYLASFILAVGNGLQVSISAQPPPSSISGSTLYYYVGSPLILTCEVTGSTSNLHYTWTSTCFGDCFVLERKVSRVFGIPLEMVDSGVHTCAVCDDNGDCSTANITLRVTGEEI